MSLEFTTQEVLFGLGGLDLKRSIDKIPPEKLSRSRNLIRTEDNGITGRPGQTAVLDAASTGEIHSLGVLHTKLPINVLGTTHPPAAAYVLGQAGSLQISRPGAAASLVAESDFSGSPLSFVSYRPPLSSFPYMFAGDTVKMRKVSPAVFDSVTGVPLALEIGLHFPPGSDDSRFRIDEFAKIPDSSIGARDRTRFTCVGFDIVDGAPGVFLNYGPLRKTTIDNFEVAGWTNNAGSGGVPVNALDGTIKKEGISSVKFTSNNGAAAYYNFWSKAFTLDLSVLGGAVTSADEDHIHVWMRLDRPDVVDEIRIYFVLDATFDLATLPGTSDTLNTEAYVKSFRPSDYTGFFEISKTALQGASAANVNDSTAQNLKKTKDKRKSTEKKRSQRDRKRVLSSELGPGRGAWTEFGVLGVPLRRGDFQRIGTDETRDWRTVTGIVIVLSTLNNTDAIRLWMDEMYIHGGAGLDASDIGSLPYDYRYRHYDPRTGAKSNPSPVQTESFKLDSVRRSVVITPISYGNTYIRQQFFRRGGTLVNDWYYVGINGSDGGLWTDALSDDSIVNAETIAIDNDQPVTTVDKDGNAVYVQPLPAIFGPVNDLIFGCGDPQRPGYVYHCKPGEPDHWPANNLLEICDPSEELMGGTIFGGNAFAFSRARLFGIYPNLATQGKISYTTTQCKHGLVTRWAHCITPIGIAFVSNDGIYLTNGGPEVNLSDDDIRGIFFGEARNGYLPVDFSTAAAREALRLTMVGNDIWFQYRDTGGTNRHLIYSVVMKYWRAYDFGRTISSVAVDDGADTLTLVMGARATNKVYSHLGATDDGLAIACSGRTGALDQGAPRQTKLYGDAYLDILRNGVDVTVTPHYDFESASLAPAIVSAGAGRQKLYLDMFGDSPLRAYNISFDFAWSSSGAHPVIYSGGPSFIVQPDTTQKRVTDWDDLGLKSDKFVKGCRLIVDTGGVAKTFEVQADQATQVTPLSVNTSGRMLVEFSWSQFQGRLIRLKPLDAVPWTVYDYDWVWDPEPLGITRWETQETDHGLGGWHQLAYGFIALRSTAQVDLTVTTYDQLGGSVTNTYPFASTGDAKRKLFQGFAARKGVFYKYVFTSAAAFHLYREESVIYVQSWGGNQLLPVRPFGNDDTDGVRAMAPSSRDAFISTARGGGGY